MSMFSIFNISGSAVSAQSQRLNVVASNLANVDAVLSCEGREQSMNSLEELPPLEEEQDRGGVGE